MPLVVAARAATVVLDDDRHAREVRHARGIAGRASGGGAARAGSRTAGAGAATATPRRATRPCPRVLGDAGAQKREQCENGEASGNEQSAAFHVERVVRSREVTDRS